MGSEKFKSICEKARDAYGKAYYRIFIGSSLKPTKILEERMKIDRERHRQAYECWMAKLGK